MTGVFATEDGVGPAHFGFDVRVPDAGTYSLTSQPGDEFRYALGDDQVVENS